MGAVKKIREFCFYMATFGALKGWSFGGVVASLLAVPLLFLLRSIYWFNTTLFYWAVIGGIVLSIGIIQIALRERPESAPFILFDKTVGMIVAFIGMPLMKWRVIVFGFILFQFLIALRPFPWYRRCLDYARRLPGAVGVLVPSLITGFLVNVFFAYDCVGYGVIRLLYPSLCQACGCFVDEQSVFCSDCFTSIGAIEPLFLPVNDVYSLRVDALSNYKGPMKSLVLKKFSGDMVASHKLAVCMLERLELRQCDYLIPVPLHWTRYARRGFNQSKQMCRIIAQQLNIPMINILRRKKRTGYQSGLSVVKRAENVEGVFAPKKQYQDIMCGILKGKRVVIVDDLCTTGATLKNIALVLAQGKPRAITAAVACRVC